MLSKTFTSTALISLVYLSSHVIAVPMPFFETLMNAAFRKYELISKQLDHERSPNIVRLEESYFLAHTSKPELQEAVFKFVKSDYSSKTPKHGDYTMIGTTYFVNAIKGNTTTYKLN
jgi:hypothetical protein